MWLYVILVVILIKTSLLGLGLVSIVLSAFGLLLLKLNVAKPTPFLQLRAKKMLRTALWLHLSVYALLILKLLLIDSYEDVPMFIASHLVLHHFMAALIGATLIVMLARSYFAYKDTHCVKADD